MAAYYFKIVDNDGILPADEAFQFPDLFSAVDQAKLVLAEMALDGLPNEPLDALEIEVQNSHKLPIVRMRLELKIQFLPDEGRSTVSIVSRP